MRQQLQMILLRLALLVPLTFACSPGTPQSEVASQPEQDFIQIPAKLESDLPDLMIDGKIPGTSVCWIHNYEIAWCSAFGTKDADRGSIVENTTVFQAASLSKPVFAYTVLQLVEHGLLDLDTPLLDYVGEATAREKHLGTTFDDPRAATITARHVLNHTTGFPNWRRDQDLRIQFDPGERFSYSGEGFGLLQMVVEELTGSSLEDLVRELTFEPLLMNRSTFSPSTAILEDYAWPHDSAGELAPRPENLDRRIENAKSHAAGSLLTTADDYARFVVALMTGAGLSKASSADFLRPQIEVPEGRSVFWGLGVGLEESATGVNAFHWGDNGNSKAFFLADPAQGNAIVYFANAYNGLSILDDLIDTSMGPGHPILYSSLLNYPQHDSPEFRFSQAVYSGGAADGVGYIRQLEADGNDHIVAEAVVNDLGYWLLGRDRLDEALVLFELNAELYPEAWNVFDSLGEAQLMKGLREKGLANYRRSLELNSENNNAANILAEHGELRLSPAQSSDSPK